MKSEDVTQHQSDETRRSMFFELLKRTTDTTLGKIKSINEDELIGIS